MAKLTIKIVIFFFLSFKLVVSQEVEINAIKKAEETKITEFNIQLPDKFSIKEEPLIYLEDSEKSVYSQKNAERESGTLLKQPFVEDSTEREALVALYNSTNGASWINNTNWNTEKPIEEWYGVTVTNSHVTSLVLLWNNLSGPIPKEIGNLTSLTYLDLGGNNLSGSIPDEIGNLTLLTDLILTDNMLTGEIPTSIANLTSLTLLSFFDNNLSGPIPDEIGNLTLLTDLILSTNQLTGSIPTAIGNLTSLTVLGLHNNNLSGPIPDEIGNLTLLEYLVITYNQLTGTIPTVIGNLTSLISLGLENNKFDGAVPDEIKNLTELERIDLRENKFNELPNLSPLTKMRELHIEKNKFTFEDIEPNIGVASTRFTYAPQDSIGNLIDTTVCLGTSYSAKVSVGGINNKYQWRKNGTPIPGAIDSVYIIPTISSSDAGAYSCEITNTIATALTLYSRQINLKVNELVCIDFDIKPQACRNPLNVKAKGKIPAAIIGSADFNVSSVNPATLLLNGVKPLKWKIEDVTTPVDISVACDPTLKVPDGFDDLILKFDIQELVNVLEPVNDGDELELTIQGKLFDDTQIEGSDCVIILNKGKLDKQLAASDQKPEINDLSGNYPNPFNPTTKIEYSIKENSNVKIVVYNMLGQEIATLVNGEKSAGTYYATFDATGLPSGMYYCKMVSNNFNKTIKMLLTK